MENYSVLMSVYDKVEPSYFREAIRSMMAQTLVTDDFVIVCDGPLNEALDEVIAQAEREYPGVFQIVRLAENMGIGAAAEAGLRRCKNDLVAKMDSDDIALPERCEKQVRRFMECPELMVLGGLIEEFDSNPDQAFAVRTVPCTYEEIRHFARRRQPFNNVTVMYRQKAVLAVGGYRNLRRSEDFDLYLRLLYGGCYAENLDAVLVKVRVNNSAVSRRASWDTLVGCARSRWYSFRIGYASLLDVIICVLGEAVIVLSPPGLQQYIYKRFLRKQSDGAHGGRKTTDNDT